jgi:hypothetical protein
MGKVTAVILSALILAWAFLTPWVVIGSLVMGNLSLAGILLVAWIASLVVWFRTQT